MSNLTPVIKSIQDIMRQDSGVDGDAQRISQLTWLLFLKVFDALEEELELTRDHYQSPIPEAMRWRNWAADPEGITGDALLDFVDNQLFATLKSLSADPVRNPRGYVVRGVFEDAYPPGVKNYNKTKPIRIEEFDAEKAWWGTEADGFAARVENERAWKVSIDTIRAANWNLDQKNPHVGEQTSHDPGELLADYARLQAEAQALRDELKGILAESLAKTAASA